MTIKTQERLTCFNLREIPAYIKRRFKAYCARRGMNMRGFIMSVMEEEVKSLPTREEMNECKYKGDDRVTLFVINIPRDIITNFKAACAQNDISMQETLIFYMKGCK